MDTQQRLQPPSGAPIPLSPVPSPPQLFRPGLRALIVPSLFTLVLLSVMLAGRRTPTAVDAAVDARLAHSFDRWQPLLQSVVRLGDPGNVALASLALASLCVTVRANRAALLALCGPPLAGALTQWILKPLIDFRPEGGPAFPSGHATGACAVALALVLLLLPGGVLRERLGEPARMLLWCVATVFGVGVSISLVLLGYHHPTEILGGASVAIMVIGALACFLDDRPAVYRC